MDKSIIDSFSEEWEFLSNFYPCDIFWMGVLYKSAEHAYQASKTPFEDEQEMIARQETPGRAKRAGSKITLREEWDDIKLDVMRGIVSEKFSTEPMITRMLSTENALLIEGNNWGDTFWGCIDDGSGNWVGKNWLGRILMETRKQLKGNN